LPKSPQGLPNFYRRAPWSPSPYLLPSSIGRRRLNLSVESSLEVRDPPAGFPVSPKTPISVFRVIRHSLEVYEPPPLTRIQYFVPFSFELSEPRPPPLFPHLYFPVTSLENPPTPASSLYLVPFSTFQGSPPFLYHVFAKKRTPSRSTMRP